MKAYIECAADVKDDEKRRIILEKPVLRAGGRFKPKDDDIESDEEEEAEGEDEEEESAGGPGGGSGSGGGKSGKPASKEKAGGSGDLRWRVFSLGGPYDYGDEVKPPKGAHTLNGACLFEEDGWPIAAKQVKEAELDQFMALVSIQDARILPVTRGRSGKRYKSWGELADNCTETELEDWPLAGVRTTSWCVDYLQRMGETIESHHESFVRKCKLERNSWGVQWHWQASNLLKFMGEVDQLDIFNIVAAEAAFRDIQTIEYSYMDKARELDNAGGGGGRLTSEEQAMFAGSSRMSTTLMVCPGLLEQVKAEVDREGGLLKNLVKAREARAALKKK